MHKKITLYISIVKVYKNNVMDTIVLENLDCLKGNLKKMLLNQYQNRHLIKVLKFGQITTNSNNIGIPEIL